MAVGANWYGLGFVALANKEIDWTGDTIKMALLDSGYTPDLDADDYFDDVSADEITGTAYTAGGEALTGRTAPYAAGTNIFSLKSADVSWATATFTARYAVIYNASPASDATRPLILLIDFDADSSPVAENFTITQPADGWGTVTIT